MPNNENVTKLEVAAKEKTSTKIVERETLSEVSQVLSKMYETESETPESYLITQAVRLNNVVHSLVEEREKNYLSDENNANTRKIDSDDLDAIVKLSQEARENMKLAMSFKKDKVKLVAEIIQSQRGR